jgi:hypothetical protein
VNLAGDSRELRNCGSQILKVRNRNSATFSSPQFRNQFGCPQYCGIAEVRTKIADAHLCNWPHHENSRLYGSPTERQMNAVESLSRPLFQRHKDLLCLLCWKHIVCFHPLQTRLYMILFCVQYICTVLCLQHCALIPLRKKYLYGILFSLWHVYVYSGHHLDFTIVGRSMYIQGFSSDRETKHMDIFFICDSCF